MPVIVVVCCRLSSNTVTAGGILIDGGSFTGSTMIVTKRVRMPLSTSVLKSPSGPALMAVTSTTAVPDALATVSAERMLCYCRFDIPR